MVNIRFAEKGDIDFLLDNTHLSESQISIKMLNHELIITHNNSENIGLLVLDLLWNHIPFIAYIWVAENHRNRGIGKELLSFLEIFLLNKNEKVLFSSSMETAAQAKNWHKRMGFLETGIIHNINNGNVGEVFFRKELK